MRSFASLLLCTALAACGSEAPTRVDAAAPAALPDIVGCGRAQQHLCPVPAPADAPSVPERLRPTAVALDPAGLAWVALSGTESRPGDSVAVVDPAAGRVLDRVQVGPRPVAVAVRPGGAWLVVASEFARYLTVIDPRTRAAVGRVELGFYAQDLAFDPSGRTLVVSEKARDGVWILTAGETGPVADDARWIPLGGNPDQVSVCPDGRSAVVALFSRRELARIDLATGQVVRAVVNAPPNDVLCQADAVLVATLGEGSGHPVQGSPECAGATCDATEAVRFSDIANDVAVFDPTTLTPLQRYTSDTAEVSRRDPRGALRPGRMVVRGAFPRRMALAAGRLVVTMGASAELWQPVLSPGGVLGAGGLHSAGFGPDGVALTPNGRVAIVANRLSDDLSVIDLDTGVQSRVSLDVLHDGAAPPAFPATDEEIGELFFNSAMWSSDGDGACIHCHPGGATDGKAWSVATVPLGESRLVPPTRNLRDTLPLLLEGTQSADGFQLEMEDLSPREDYDPDPADEFAAGKRARDEAFQAISAAVIGRPLGFRDLVQAVGRFLVAEPRLLPNPHPVEGRPEVDRGRHLFESPAVACAACHPADDGFTTREAFKGVIAQRVEDTPNRDLPADVAGDFAKAAPGVFDTPSLRGLWDRPQRFLHDGRARSAAETFLPPGHAALATGALGFNFGGGFGPGARVFDTHGGASHLSPEDVRDLLAYLETIE